MTLSQSDLLEFLDAIRAGGDTDAIRQGAEFLYQALIEAEATETVGAAHYERSDDRVTQRNGHRPRTLSTGNVNSKWPHCDHLIWPHLGLGGERRARVVSWRGVEQSAAPWAERLPAAYPAA